VGSRYLKISKSKHQWFHEFGKIYLEKKTLSFLVISKPSMNYQNNK
jgi:hypothetical protein